MPAFILQNSVPAVTRVTLTPDGTAARGLALGVLLGSVVWMLLGAVIYLSISW
jgi:hypothetical protein